MEVISLATATFRPTLTKVLFVAITAISFEIASMVALTGNPEAEVTDD